MPHLAPNEGGAALRAEFVAMSAARFTRLDKNRGGFLSFAERAPIRPLYPSRARGAAVRSLAAIRIGLTVLRLMLGEPIKDTFSAP